MSDRVDVTKKTTNVTVRGGCARVITLDRRTVAEIERNRPRPVQVRRPTPVVVQDKRPQVQIGGGMGVQGPPGETEGAIFNVVNGETIHGGRAVKVVNGAIFAPNTGIAADAPQVVGIALQSGGASSANQVRTAGQMSEGFWNWSPGFVYCDNAGVLVQPAPATGWILAVARVVNPTTIEVDIDTPFLRTP